MDNNVAIQNLIKHSNKSGIPLRNINNMQFVGDIYLGQPVQKLTVMFDTGSALMYALTSNCTRGCPSSLTTFAGNESSTFQSFADKKQEQNYGRGYVSGAVAKDKLCFEEKGTDCPEVEFLAVDHGQQL